MVESLPTVKNILWKKSYRIITTRFPTIDLFERVGNPEDWESVCELESLTNARILETTGEYTKIPLKERVSGSGATYVMAPFCHLHESRFSDGSFGIYYAASTIKTAHYETKSFMERFYEKTAENRQHNDFRMLVGGIDANLHDISNENYEVLHQESWAESQKYGAMLKEHNSNGVHFNSVRHRGGKCVGIFRPSLIKPPVQAGHFQYNWDGRKIKSFHCYSDGQEVVL